MFVHSKILIFVPRAPALSNPVHFSCNPLPPQHKFALVSYPTPFQKKFLDAYKNQELKREKIIICFKLNI